MSPSRSKRRSGHLEANAASQQRNDELVERDALLGGESDELLVEGGGASDEDLPVGCHAANNIAYAIDITSSACDITPMTTAQQITTGTRVRVQITNWDSPGPLVYTVESIDSDFAVVREPRIPGLEGGTHRYPVAQLVAA